MARQNIYQGMDAVAREPEARSPTERTKERPGSSPASDHRPSAAATARCPASMPNFLDSHGARAT
jgi:hypothetical protein